jgi:hypothetical protein
LGQEISECWAGLVTRTAILVREKYKAMILPESYHAYLQVFRSEANSPALQLPTEIELLLDKNASV